MRFAAGLVVVVLGSSTVAFANPVELGAGVGLTQASSDAQDNQSSRQADTLFARVGVFGPISAQAEIGRVDSTGSSVRSVTAAAVLELGHRRVVPFILAGVGADTQSDSVGDSNTYQRYEGGVGLEYRASGGLTIGVDLREGTRTGGPGPQVFETAPSDGGSVSGGTTHLAPLYNNALTTGEYRTARVTIGVSF
jgi:hypothetical protein|nr:hypothetical protein [Kofleriaceae bacterium]